MRASANTDGSQAQVVTPFTTTPNLVHPSAVTAPLHVIETTQDGSLGNPATVGNQPLNAQTVLHIKHRVTLDGTLEVYGIGIYGPNGSLTFSRTVNTQLEVTQLYVFDGALLEVGRETAPINTNVTATILIADKPIQAVDAQQNGNGVFVWGKILMHGAVKDPTWVRLTAAPNAGAMSLQADQAISGWRQNDNLILPDSRQLNRTTRSPSNYLSNPHWDEVQVNSVSGNQISLKTGLAHAHPGAPDVDGAARFFPHVANLSRSVIVMSESETGTRGLFHCMYRAHVDIRYSLFKNLGRTKISATDTTTNVEGRWPVAFIGLMGPVAPVMAPSYQFVFMGNAIQGDRISADAVKFGLVLHNSHFGLIKDNVVDRVGGGGIATWGGESGNLFEHNSVTRIPGNALKNVANNWFGNMRGSNGAGFWMQCVEDKLVDNIVANVGILNYDGGHGWDTGYVLDCVDHSMYTLPAYPGADSSKPGQSVQILSHERRINMFQGNEVYGGGTNGLITYGINISFNANHVIDQTKFNLVKDFRVWHVQGRGIWPWLTNMMLVDGMLARNDPALGEGVAFLGAEAEVPGFQMRNSDIEGWGTGVAPPAAVGSIRNAIVENSSLKNFNNVAANTLAVYASGDRLQPRDIIIRNVKFGKPDPNKPHHDVYMNYRAWSYANTVQEDRVFVYSFNQQAGNDFQVFYKQQEEDFIVPVTVTGNVSNSGLVGAAVPGLTNLQNFNTYEWKLNPATSRVIYQTPIRGEAGWKRVAIAGRITPCTDETTRPTIFGFSCPQDPNFTPPPPPPPVNPPNNPPHQSPGADEVLAFNPLKNERAILKISGADATAPEIYTSRGQKVANMSNDGVTSGVTTFTWDGRNDSGKMSAAGVYVVRSNANGTKSIKKIVLIK